MVWAARWTAAARSGTRPEVTSTAAAFSTTTSRRGPVSPAKMARRMAALAVASPPARASMGARVRPNSSGVMVLSVTDEVRGVDAHDLRGGSGGVGEGAEDVEDGADTEGAADGKRGLHSWMQAGGVEEGEAVFSECLCRVGWSQADGDSEGFEDVSGAAA